MSLSVTPRHCCSRSTLALPAFWGQDEPSPTAPSGQPTPRIQQNAATVPTPARAPPAEPIQTTPGMKQGTAHSLKTIKRAIKDYLHSSPSTNSHSWKKNHATCDFFFPRASELDVAWKSFWAFFVLLQKDNPTFSFTCFPLVNPTWGPPGGGPERHSGIPVLDVGG